MTCECQLDPGESRLDPASGDHLDVILVTNVDEKANIGDSYHTRKNGLQPLFYSSNSSIWASLAEDLITIIFIQTQATEKAIILEVHSLLCGH